MALVDPNCPWLLKSLPSKASPLLSGWLDKLVGQPIKAIASELGSRDFLFLSVDAITDRAEVIPLAEQLIDQVPSLSSVVRANVDEIFLLKAREEYDVSHSEPRWPKWIFVSAPSEVSVLSGARLAENVVHEAMHLQLTELEARTPLVADTRAKLPSPWKQEPRHIQGILHGLYVFVCISAFFERLLEDAPLPEDAVDHINRRIAVIRQEIAAVPVTHLAQGLTQAGAQFLKCICLPLRPMHS